MNNRVTYEWDIETLDGDDVVDHDHANKLSELYLRGLAIPGTRLVLVRDVGNNFDGVTDRTWAYVVDGHLPDYFINCFGNNECEIPQRFRREIKRFREGGVFLAMAIERNKGKQP